MLCVQYWKIKYLVFHDLMEFVECRSVLICIKLLLEEKLYIKLMAVCNCGSSVLCDAVIYQGL